MSIRDFAAHLGVSDRMVSKWEAAGATICPRPVNQHALDTSTRLADASARELFRLLLAGWACHWCGEYVESGVTHACKKGL